MRRSFDSIVSTNHLFKIAYNAKPFRCKKNLSTDRLTENVVICVKKLIPSSHTSIHVWTSSCYFIFIGSSKLWCYNFILIWLTGTTGNVAAEATAQLRKSDSFQIVTRFFQQNTQAFWTGVGEVVAFGISETGFAAFLDWSRYTDDSRPNNRIHL